MLICTEMTEVFLRRLESKNKTQLSFQDVHIIVIFILTKVWTWGKWKSILTVCQVKEKPQTSALSSECPNCHIILNEPVKLEPHTVGMVTWTLASHLSYFMNITQQIFHQSQLHSMFCCCCCFVSKQSRTYHFAKYHLRSHPSGIVQNPAYEFYSIKLFSQFHLLTAMAFLTMWNSEQENSEIQKKHNTTKKERKKKKKTNFQWQSSLSS